MVALRDSSGVGDALAGLAGALESLDLGPELSRLEVAGSRLAATIRSYLIPRASDPNTPLTVVFAGPTGSGKSTLINSLTRRDLAATGPLRPTTTRPLVLASSEVADHYETVGGVSCQVVTGDAPVLSDMVLVDTPDIDSVALAHRASAETLMDNADVVVFVTSAARYADDVPWQVLRRAEARGSEVINVLNRVSSSTSGAISDFKARLREAGLSDELVTIPEHHLSGAGWSVPSTAIRSLGRRLVAISSEREKHASETFQRVLRSMIGQASDLTRHIDELADETDSLEAEVALYLADRVTELRVGGIVDGLYDLPPEGATRWTMRRWRVANRLRADEVTTAEQVIVDRFVALVQGDLHRWIVEERHLDFDAGEVVAVLAPTIRSEAEGWIYDVARVVAEGDERERWLSEAALIDSAASGAETSAALALFGDRTGALVDRVRREMMVHLERVYQHAGSHLIEIARRARGSLDVSGLRAALGAVSATLTHVDA